MPTPATEPHRELLDSLARIEARENPDSSTLELTCSWCELSICTIDADDGLDVLVGIALMHLHDTHPA